MVGDLTTAKMNVIEATAWKLVDGGFTNSEQGCLNAAYEELKKQSHSNICCTLRREDALRRSAVVSVGSLRSRATVLPALASCPARNRLIVEQLQHPFKRGSARISAMRLRDCLIQEMEVKMPQASGRCCWSIIDQASKQG